MRILILAAFLLIRTVLHASLVLSGDNGWSAVLRIADPAALTKPLFFLLINKSQTNSEMLVEETNQYLIPLDLEDGRYDYVLLDGAKKTLEKGQFVLETPFRAFFRQIGPDFVEADIVSGGQKPLTAKLWMSGKLIRDAVTNASQQKRLRFDGLEGSKTYVLELASGNYRTRMAFVTGPENVALNRPVYGTFTRYPESRFVDDTSPVLTRVNDGRWEWYRGMAASGEVDTEDQFVFINLQRVRPIRTVRVVWSGNNYPLSYDLVFGQDGKTWDAIRRDQKGYVSRTAADNTPVRVDEIRTNITAGTVGILVKKGTRLHNRRAQKNHVELLEIEVYE